MATILARFQGIAFKSLPAVTATLLLGVAVAGQAAPFTACPTEAFLTQRKPALMYGVDLTTGQHNQLAEMPTSDKLNAMGFNYHDAYLYAWYYQGQTLARIHADFSIEPLTLGTTLQADYFVGDVSVLENAYYMYRKNGAYGGLWRVSLDDTDPAYLNPVNIISGASLYLRIFDMAFHPDNGYLYSVDNMGVLLRIDPATGGLTNLGNVGESGTFGAVYFDIAGTLYISRNQDGNIFNIDVEAATPQATFFSYGPSSTNNDGARCALAPVPPPQPATLDFGDAPVSYGTREEDNGARHTIDGLRYLGTLVDAETRAFTAPEESDDSKDNSDDEDGISFMTALTVGEAGVLNAQMQGAAYLSVWIDFDRNGAFEADERVVSDADSQSSSGFFNFQVPEDAVPGDTWARARFSSATGLGPTGAAPDGEVEDYPVTLSLSQTTTLAYPSANGYVSLAYEDLWPSRGDYDMNDFVVYYRTGITHDNADVGSGQQEVREIRIEGEIVAVGASFHSGFAVSIPGVKTRDIDVSNIELLVNDAVPTSTDNGSEQPFQPLRGTVSRLDETALLEITRDVWNTVERGEGCTFHRTDNNCGAAASAHFSLTVPISGSVPLNIVEQGVLNPFIFATNEQLRNSIFTDADGNAIAPGDALEVHLKNRPPSWRADPSLLGRADDQSNTSTLDTNEMHTYQNAQGLPWAIEIGGRWCHPGEYQDLTVAFPDFANFVATEGAESADWFHADRAATHPQLGAQGYLYKEDGVLDINCAGAQ